MVLSMLDGDAAFIFLAPGTPNCGFLRLFDGANVPTAVLPAKLQAGHGTYKHYLGDIVPVSILMEPAVPSPGNTPTFALSWIA